MVHEWSEGQVGGGGGGEGGIARMQQPRKLNTILIAGKFGGLAVYITTAKLKSAKISYSHVYIWQSRTEPPNLNPPIFLQ